MRAYFDEAYLWYGEVPVVDAAAPAYSNDTATGFYTSIDAYFGGPEGHGQGSLQLHRTTGLGRCSSPGRW